MVIFLRSDWLDNPSQIHTQTQTRVCVCVCVCVCLFVCYGLFCLEGNLFIGWKCLKNLLHRRNYRYIRFRMYVVYTISFQTFFVQAFNIVVDSWKFIILLLYITGDDWPIIMISGSNEQREQEWEYILLNPDCLSWWIFKNTNGTWGTFRRKMCSKILF